MEKSMDKKQIRKMILGKREDLNKEVKAEKDNIILKKLLNSEYYKKAKNIFVYISFGSEINTYELINTSLKEGKRIYVPRTEYSTKVMDAVKIVSLNNLHKSKYGILEPSIEDKAIDPNDLDLIIVPGVAFDKLGGRIGYGAGYYDRYFSKISEEYKNRIVKLVLAYDFQVFEKVPTSEHDVSTDYIITENTEIKIDN